MYDVLIIGCGVIGSAMAYTLSRYQLKVCVCERFNDVANGVTKANSAILHAGFDCPPGSLEARMNLEGIAMAREICKKLDVEYRDIPSFVIAFDEREMEYVRELYDRGVANGVPGVRIIDREEALRLEPGLNPKLIGALYAPGSGIINPWEYAVAMAETAVRNGVEVKLSSRVTGIERNEDHFVVTTSSGSYEARYVINAGGAFSAQVYELVGGRGVVILGSGDIGLIMARRMTLEGANVLACVELMPYSNGLNRNIVQCLKDYGIPLYLSHTITNIVGRERVEQVVVSEVGADRRPIPGTEITFDCDTVLLSVGLIPENELTRAAGISIDSRTSGAVVFENMETVTPGIFSCGNVVHVHDLVDFVTAESRRAGAAAARYAAAGQSSPALSCLAGAAGPASPAADTINDK